MVFKNLTAKELYASIPSTPTISQFMKTGLGSTQLAVSAMEEFLIRGDQEKIHENLIWALTRGCLKPGTSMSSLIARSLIESHDASSYTKIIGMGLLKNDLAEMRKTIAESFEACYSKTPRSGEKAAAESLFQLYEEAGIKWESGSEQIEKATGLF